MSAHVIAMIGLKGGMGRTTVGMQLAMAFARRGQKVVVIDADPQAAAATWHETTPTDGVTVVRQGGGRGPDLVSMVQDIDDTCDIVVIDCPARSASHSDRAAACADLVLAPIPLGAPEVWATPRVIELVSHARAQKPELLFAGVINRARHTSLARFLFHSLNEMEGLPLLKSRLNDRLAYCDVATPLRDKVAIRETDALADEVLGLLAKRPVEFAG